MSRRIKDGCTRLFSSGGDYLRSLTNAAGQQIVDSARATWVHRRDASGRILERHFGVQLKPGELDREQPRSACSITRSELEANASFALKPSKTSRLPEYLKLQRVKDGLQAEDFGERAHNKVQNWGFASANNRAVTVIPREFTSHVSATL